MVARYGESGTVPYLLPLSVDGLIVVASVSLVELAGRRRDTDTVHRLPPGEPLAAAVTHRAADAASDPALVTVAPTESRAAAARDLPPAGLTLPLEYQRADVDAQGLRDVLDGDQRCPAGGQRVDSEAAETSDTEPDQGRPNKQKPCSGVRVEPATELVPLMPAARAARDELTREGRTVNRDALARQLRRNGHSIRNSGVSELLALLRQEASSDNGSHPIASVQRARSTRTS